MSAKSMWNDRKNVNSKSDIPNEINREKPRTKQSVTNEKKRRKASEHES